MATDLLEREYRDEQANIVQTEIFRLTHFILYGKTAFQMCPNHGILPYNTPTVDKLPKSNPPFVPAIRKAIPPSRLAKV